MAAGKLEVEIVARTEKLEAGLKKAESSVKNTANKMDTAEQRAAKMGKGLEAASAAAGKVAIAVAAIDVALKGATAQVSAFRGAMALLRGDTEGALKGLEGFGTAIRSLPILGGIIGGIADSLFGLIDAVTGITEGLEKLEKQLVKVKAEGMAASKALDVKRQNIQLEKQLELMKETNEQKRSDMQLAIEIEALERKRRVLMVEVTDQHTKGTRAHKVALEQIDQQIALEREILELKHQQEKEARMVAAFEEGRRQAAEKRAQLEREMAEQARQREKELADLERERLRRAKEAADEKKRIAAEEKKALEEQIRLEEQRLGAIGRRLGLVSKEAQTKTGFTNQGQTAFGTFTFGEQNVDEKIRQLQEEANKTQQSIDKKTGAIETLLQTLTQKIGFA